MGIFHCYVGSPECIVTVTGSPILIKLCLVGSGSFKHSFNCKEQCHFVWSWSPRICISRWWFQMTFFNFHPYLGKIPIFTIFRMGWNHQLDYYIFIYTHKRWTCPSGQRKMCSIQGLDHQPQYPLDETHIPPHPSETPKRVGSTFAGTRYRHFGFQSGGCYGSYLGLGGCFMKFQKSMRLQDMPRSWTAKNTKTYNQNSP